jgi:hypothetical protein
MLPHRAGKKKVRMTERLSFDDATALKTIETFIAHLWWGPRAPAELYIQQGQLPIILTYVSNGTYARAMRSIDEMNALIDHLGHQLDQAANMIGSARALHMCNLYSITTNQAAIIALFRVVNRYVGNFAPMPGVFPDYPAPVVRSTDIGRELT